MPSHTVYWLSGVQYVATSYLICLTCTVDVSGFLTTIFFKASRSPTLFLFCFSLPCVVEEILVCSDRSQPEILQGFNCRGGEIFFILYCIFLHWTVHCFASYLPCVTSGLWSGWWDRPVNLLQCNWVPGSTQLWLPNTCKRLCLLIKYKYLHCSYSVYIQLFRYLFAFHPSIYLLSFQ